MESNTQNEDDKQSGADTGQNSYIALRDAKIARNQARLKELGLLNDSTNDANHHSRIKKKKSTQVASNDPPRRSSRLKGMDAVEYKYTEPPLLDDTRNFKKRQRNETEKYRPTGKEQTLEDIRKEMKNNITAEGVTPNSSSLASNSARAMRLNVHQLLLGEDGLLGRLMAKTGKAFVMQESARHAVSNFDDSVCSSVSFNKYSGVQEWGNDVLFLWVNIDAPGSDVINTFLENGQQVTWFGGSKMHEGTKVIQRLKQVGSRPVDSALLNNPMNGVVLWCRKYDSAKKTFTPYVCFGRLSLVSYDPTLSPLAFVWNLLDYERLKQQDTFLKIVNNSST